MKRTCSFVSLVLFFSIASSLPAAIEKDLGQALAYLRVTDELADATVAMHTIDSRPALVLDLRSLPASARLAGELHAALAKAPAAHAVRFVLINSTTAPSIIAALDDSLPSVITIGPRSPALTPDVAVSTSDEEDRRAYDALAADTPLEKLVTDSHEKPRYDEAKLVQDHANGVTTADADLPADADDDSITTSSADGDKPAKAGKKAAPAAVIDLVLERAIQIHRALLALKRL
jgi:hypothetical protein